MKHLMLIDESTGSPFIIDEPVFFPSYSVGTRVIFNVKEDKNSIKIEGDVIGINIVHNFNPNTLDEKSTIEYKVLDTVTNITYDVPEPCITEFYPSTNEFDVAFHKDQQKA